MPEDINSYNYKDKSASKIIKDIHDGIIDGEDVPQDVRQECVEYLWHSEGYSSSAIANALHVSERTIKRDKSEIKKRNVQKPSAEYALEVIGELLSKATAAHEHLMRLSRSSSGSIQEKSQAAFFVWKVIQEQAKLLQSLGYLPEKPIQVEADFHHHQEEEESPAVLKEKLAKLEKLAETKDKIDPEISKLLDEAKKQIALAEARGIVKELEKRLGESEKEENSSK